MHEDDEIQQLEADLRRSQFTKWDAETFLAKRHQAKIDALTKPRGKWKTRVLVAREIADELCLILGRITAPAIFAYWMLTY